MFGRRKRGDRADDDVDEQGGADQLDPALDDVDGVGADADPVEDAPTGLRARPDGPWDLADEGRPDDDRPQLDLGALRIPGAEGMSIRVDVDQASSRPVAVNLVIGQGALQLQAFAAPRTLGLWDEIRGELLSGLSAQKGAPVESDGPFGPELTATVTAPTPDGKTTSQKVRFVGVDGPRWFLRGVLSGKAVSDSALADRLLDVFRGVVVVRGADAMPPRELLPLQIPAQPGEQQSDDEQAGDQQSGTKPADDLKPFERGPEITERR